MNRRSGRTNRIGLALIGLTLTGAGGIALARAANLGPRLLGSGHGYILGQPARRLAAGNWWFLPLLAIIAAVIALLALAWLIALVRPATLRRLNLEPDPRRGSTHLTTRAATNALEADLTSSPHIRNARATFTGRPAEITLIVTVPPDTEPADACTTIEHAMTRFRGALETDRLSATVQIR